MLKELKKCFTGISTVICMIIVLALTSLTVLGQVTNFVSVGGHDIDGSSDKNFSIVAMVKKGVVSGNYTDRFAADGLKGFHSKVYCLSVSGNEAWIGGIITQGDDLYTEGSYVMTRVADNGKSSKDTPDQISFSFLVPPEFPCEVQPNFPLFNMSKGQVTVR